MRRTIRAWLALPLVGGSTALMVTTVIAALLGFPFWSLATHRYSAHTVGAGTVLIALGGAVSLLAAQGLQPALLVRLPDLPRERQVQAALAAATRGAIRTGVLAVFACLVLPRLTARLELLTSPLAVILVVAVAIFQTVGLVIDTTFVAQRRARGMTARNTAFAMGKLAGLALAVSVSPAAGEAAIAGSWAVANALASAAGLLWLARRCVLRVGGVGAEWRTLTNGRHHHISAVSGLLPMYLLPIIVSIRAGGAQAAYYNVAATVGLACLLVSPAVANALVPDGRYEPDRLLRRARLGTLITVSGLLLPIAVVSVVGGRLLDLFGSGYGSEGWPLLIAIAISAIPDAITNMAVAVYRATSRLRAAASLNTLMMAITIAGSWLFIPSAGIVAAGWSRVAAQTAGAIAVLVYALWGGKRDRTRVAAPLRTTPSTAAVNTEPGRS